MTQPSQAAYRRSEQLRVYRLSQVRRVSRTERLRAILLAYERSQRQRGDCSTPGRRQLPNAAQEGEAILLRHANVTDEHVGTKELKALEALGSGTRALDGCARVAEDGLDQVPSIGLIVHDEDADALQVHG